MTRHRYTRTGGYWDWSGMKRAIIFSFVLVVLVALIGGFAWFQYVMKPEFIRTAISGMQQPPTTVSAVEAKTENWRPMLTAIGTFRAVSGIDVTPQVTGVVEAIHFESGEEVEAGAPLVKLDDSIEQADLKSGEARLKKTELDLERQQELLSRGNTPRTTYDAAVAEHDTAMAAVERTRAVIAQKNIVAPFAGRLGQRMVDLGEYVSPGAAMVSLQKLDPIYVDFPMPEQEVAVIETGQSTEVRVDAYPDMVFTGRISSVDAQVNQETRTVLVRAEVANSDMRLLPGMFANVTVMAGAPHDVVTVPTTAVTYSLYGDSVYVVKTTDDEAAVAERRFVQLGAVRESRVAVSDGLAAGERVITAGQIKLQPDARVTVDNTLALRYPAERPRE